MSYQNKWIKGKQPEASPPPPAETADSAADAADSAKAKAKAEKEERRRLKMIELQQKGIIGQEGPNAAQKKPTTKAERRAKQESERAAKQARAQQKPGGGHQQQQQQQQHHRDGMAASVVTRDGRESRAELGGQQATAAASSAHMASHHQNASVNMSNRVLLEDKRMHLYSHLDFPHHPPTTASALALGQPLGSSNTATAEHRTGDAGAFVAGVKNASFPPGPQVIVGMARDAYVVAETGEPATVTIAGAGGAPIEATLRDAAPPYASGPGQRRFTKLTNQSAGITIHPRIKEVGLRMATMEIAGANARAASMLAAFIDVIADYTTPPQTSLYRNLMVYLSPQINFLVHQRPMCVGMGNAIRFLKDEVVRIPADMDEATAKSMLTARIRDYMKERITAAGDVIAEAGAQKIKDGDVILTFGASSTVQRLLIAAHKAGRRFRVIVIDSRPQFEGRKLVRRLIEAGLTDLGSSVDSGSLVAAPTDLNSSRGKGRGRNGSNGGVTYAPIIALGFLMREASKVFLGAEAFFANGAMLSRAGTAMVALAAQSYHVPVIVACETYKFSERVQLDAVVGNELGTPDALMYKAGNPDAEPVGMQSNLSLSEMEYSAYARDRYSARPRWNNRGSRVDDASNEISAGSKQGKASKNALTPNSSVQAKAEAKLGIQCPLNDWRTTRNLRLVNLAQDITPPDFVSVIITEVGMIPTTSIPVVLREYKNQI